MFEITLTLKSVIIQGSLDLTLNICKDLIKNITSNDQLRR